MRDVCSQDGICSSYSLRVRCLRPVKVKSSENDNSVFPGFNMTSETKGQMIDSPKTYSSKVLERMMLLNGT